MPEIDTDLFQVIALALLLCCLLALLAALSTLAKISKQLAAGTTTRESAPAAAASYEPAQTYAAPQAQTRAAEISTAFVPMTEAAPVASQPASSNIAAGGIRGDEPEEQPFERDGRWWFKRGGELLVYDEGTGQWVGASGSAVAAASTAPGTATAVVNRTDVGEGWKCSSCGAVNGSTATSCRMCFAPR